MRPIIWLVALGFFVFPTRNIYSQSWEEVGKIVASDRFADDWFGYTVAVSGNYAIVGAHQDDEDAQGGNYMPNTGAAYIFERNTLGVWEEKQKIVASDRYWHDWFGYRVDISGNYAIVSALQEDHDANGGGFLHPYAGAAYIFERDSLTGVWTEVQKIVASDRAQNDWFGCSVSISGEYALVGAYGEDHDTAGTSTSSSAGSAYVFKRNALGVWEEKQKIVASDRADHDKFGYSVAISNDYAIVGAYQEDHDTPSGGGVYMSKSGSAYIFERNAADIWEEKQKIVASDRSEKDEFGYSVAIDGDYTIVGACLEDHNSIGTDSLSEAGAAYIFERNTAGIWEEKQKITASDRNQDDEFGAGVDISNSYVIVGAYQEDHDTLGGDSLSEAGAAYIFERNTSGVWEEKQKIVASDRAFSDVFGHGVAISNDCAVVGAYSEDHNSIGTDSLSNAGSAYLFEIIESCDISVVPDGLTAYKNISAQSYDFHWNSTPSADSCQIWIKGYLWGVGTYDIQLPVSTVSPYSMLATDLNTKFVRYGIRCFCNGAPTPWIKENIRIGLLSSYKTGHAEVEVPTVFFDGNKLIIHTETEFPTVKIAVYDVLGRTIINTSPEKDTNQVEVDVHARQMHGQYFVTLINAWGDIYSKSILIP